MIELNVDEVGAAWNATSFFWVVILYGWWSTRTTVCTIAIVCGCLTFLCFVILLYKNISFVMMKRLPKEQT